MKGLGKKVLNAGVIEPKPSQEIGGGDSWYIGICKGWKLAVVPLLQTQQLPSWPGSL